jgi:hypothetical protein
MRDTRFLMPILEVREITFKLGLKAPDDYLDALKNNLALVLACINGVGSKESITYHITPDTVTGLNVNPSSHIHDWMYYYPKHFRTWEEGMAYKKLADDWFYENMMTQINESWGWAFRQTRKVQALMYYEILRCFGDTSFWAGKERPLDWKKHKKYFKEEN